MNFFSEVEKNIERRFSKWTEKVFGPAASDELLVVHRGILDDIESQVQTAYRGKRIFPYNALLIRVVSADPARRATFQAAFSQDQRLEKDIRECLAGAGCELPGGFSVAIETAESGPRIFEIVYEMRPIAPSAPPVQPKPEPARVIVVRGKANQDSFTLDKLRTNIGRLPELTDASHRLIRRNDVVFEEGADEVNATVSRGHAHLLYDAAHAEYRICDDRSEYGTRVFRDGRSIEVPPGAPRGERLRTGDEIYLGRACLRFEM